MEYEIDTEFDADSDNPGDIGEDGTDSELQPNFPSKSSVVESVTDNRSNLRPETEPRQERDPQTAVLIPEEEQQR